MAVDQSAEAASDVVVKDVTTDVSQDVLATDVNEAGPACDTSKPFGTPVEISELSSIGATLGLPRLTHDELTIYFEAFPSGADAGVTGWLGNYDLVTASRASVTSPFTNVTVVSSVNSADNELHPSPTGNNLMLFFAADVETFGVDRLYVATRGTTNSPFGTPTKLTISTGPQEWYPYVSSDGLTLYYSSGSNIDLTRATRATTSDPFTIDTSNVLASANTNANYEVAPAFTSDELTLYFASDRNSGNNYDIFVSTRSSQSVAFGAPKVVPELTTSYADRPGFISDDGCRIYISSDFAGSSKIYVATKPL